MTITTTNPRTTVSHQCPECGASKGLRAFKNETLLVTVKGGMSADVPGLSGFRCAKCGEEILDAASTLKFAQAGDALVLKMRVQGGERLKRTRLKLKLSQARAAQLTGGGHNAFSRYELGKAEPVAAVTNLFRLLERHPELLKELEPS